METAAPYCDAILQNLEAMGVSSLLFIWLAFSLVDVLSERIVPFYFPCIFIFKIRAKFDDRDMYNPGWKYHHWEQKGVPIRLEVGPRDIEQKQVRCVIRHNGDKMDLSVEGLAALLKTKLEEIQEDMFLKAKKERDDHVVKVLKWSDFVPNLELKNLVLTPWCGPEHQSGRNGSRTRVARSLWKLVVNLMKMNARPLRLQPRRFVFHSTSPSSPKEQNASRLDYPQHAGCCGEGLIKKPIASSSDIAGLKR
jgi:hypothetical protein